MMVRGYVRTIKTGNPVPDGTEVEIRRHVDNSLIATVATVGGLYEYVQDGSPGPYYVRVDIADEVHISSSKVVGMSGSVDISGLHLYFRLWRDGYIPNVMEQGSVFSSGAGMQVTVRSGVHLIKGVLYDQPGHVNLAIDAADSQPRIDTVVIEVMRPGSGDNVEGRTRLVVKKGTPAATPTAPSLTQTSNGVWEHPIANVTVDPAVSSIASNKVTDRRTRCNVEIPAGSITGTHIADNSIETRHIKNATILEEDLHADVVAKLNTYGYAHQTMAPFNYIDVNSTTMAKIQETSLTLSKGRWAVMIMFEGQVDSQTNSVSGIQLQLRGTAAAGLVASHAVQNAQAEVGSSNVSLTRMNPITVTATSATYTLELWAGKLSGSNGKVGGVLDMFAFRIGPA